MVEGAPWCRHAVQYTDEVHYRLHMDTPTHWHFHDQPMTRHVAQPSCSLAHARSEDLCTVKPAIHSSCTRQHVLVAPALSQHSTNKCTQCFGSTFNYKIPCEGLKSPQTQTSESIVSLSGNGHYVNCFPQTTLAGTERPQHRNHFVFCQ